VALDATGAIMASAAHEKAGEAHAEAKLLDLLRAQNRLNETATLCVTLEPCNHHGRTPPCTEAIIASGIKRVIIGARDPNPHVAGGGTARLRAAGIEVIEGVAQDECRQLIHAFAHTMQTGRPFITVKRAFTREGSMIPPKGQKTFTSPDSLRLAHALRKKAGAILTGSGTVLADNPLFTVRHVPDYLNIRRFLAILDRRGRVPPSYLAAAAARGLDALIYQSLDAAIADLARRGVQDILVEAGPLLSQAVLDSPFWTMSVTFRQADPDVVDVAFNPRQPPPFDTDKFNWDYVLPL
jgi:diaminohydroxyphosphoribosylaminopyrimidine deaminase/5-amino-6-(5-phosphoribosylamino)uracil reductase